MLVETIITLPVILVFLIGLLEFSSVLLAKIQVENGVKDAARYLARCNASEACNATRETQARNIAIYGHPNGAANQRVHGWLKEGQSAAEVIDIGNPSPGVVRVETGFDFPGSPLIGMIGFGSGIPIRARHDERLIGF